MLPNADKGNGVRDIADDGSLNLDRLTDDGKYCIECQITRATYLFGIAGCHSPQFRTGSHKSAVSKSMCMIQRVGGSYGSLCQELLGAGQVALRPRFEYGLANVHQG